MLKSDPITKNEGITDTNPSLQDNSKYEESEVTITYVPYSPEKIARILEIEIELTKIALKFGAVKAGFSFHRSKVVFCIEIEVKTDLKSLSLGLIEEAVFELEDIFTEFEFTTRILFDYQDASFPSTCYMIAL